MSNSEICKTCRGPKAKYNCGICSECSCKKCTHFVEDAFTYQENVPAELSHSQYCHACFQEHVEQPLNEYQQVVEEAREVVVFLKNQSKVTRLMDRKSAPLVVIDCDDEKDALLKMSFKAVKMGHNALIDVEFKNKKVINGSHKKIIVDSTAIPTTIDKSRSYYD